MLQVEKYYPINETVTVDNYPYGRLRTEARFGVEYVAGKGYRSTFQTVNPKTGRINNPKKSTYSQLAVLYKEVGTGHIKVHHMSANGDKEINNILKFMAEHFELFDAKHIEDMALTLLAMCKVDMQAKVVYAGCKFEEIIGFYDKLVKGLVAGTKTPTENFFKALPQLDIAAIDATKPDGFNPFRS